MRRTLLLAALALGLAACVPLADHPAGDERSAAFDVRLAGVWRAVGEDAPVLVFVGPADDTRRALHVVVVETTRDGRWKTSEYDGQTVRRGDHGFLSVRYETTGSERRGWVIARYTLTGRDRLRFAALDGARVAALIRAETLPGRVSGDGAYADVDVTMSGADLLSFLDSAAGARVFGAPRTLVRIDASGRPPTVRHQSTGTGVAPTPSR